ncbi:MAG: type II secretion system protein GspM [Gammaproteobacteria bacterium]
MRQWWQSRTDSERVFLGVGAACLLAAAYFVLLIEPLQERRTLSDLRLRAAAALGRDLAGFAGDAVELRGQVDTRRRFPADASILSVVNRTAGRAGTQEFTRRITPSGPDAVALFLDDVPFDALAGWLVRLDAEHGVDVERAVLERTEPGLVDAQLTLRARRAPGDGGR